MQVITRSHKVCRALLTQEIRLCFARELCSRALDADPEQARVLLDCAVALASGQQTPEQARQRLRIGGANVV